MKDFKIKHKKKMVLVWTILGFLMILIGLSSVFSQHIEIGANLGLGLFYGISGIYYWRMPLVELKGNVIKTSIAPLRRIKVESISQIKHFLDETTIIANGKETVISNLQMSEKDKERFIDFIQELKERISSAHLTSIEAA